MVRNTKGGNKGKKIKRCRSTAAPTKVTRYANSGEMYARVTRIFGYGMAEVLCDDGKKRLLIIRKKFKGRNKRDNIVVLHSVLLVGKREWEIVKKQEKVDLLFVYSQEDINNLKKRKNINKLIFGEEEEESVVDFDRNDITSAPLNEIIKIDDI